VSRTNLSTMRPALGLLCIVLLAVTAQAQPQESVEKPQRPAVIDEQQQQLQRRQNTFTAGVLLLIGVVTVGLLLIAAAIVWGAKVRRLARHAEPPSGRQDDLWYLRHASRPSEDADHASAPPADQDALS
jgi:hypothetical protein